MSLTRRLGRVGAALAMSSALFGGIPVASAAPTLTQDANYLVVFNQSSVPADAAQRIARAGGRLVTSYDAIGVALARTNNTSFRANIKQDSTVSDAGDTSRGVVRIKDRLNDGDDADDARAVPATDNDSLSALQWDMKQIQAPEAHRISGGSRDVLVADIDTGLDFKHPDLKQNIDFAASASCIGGTPDQSPAAWNDDNGHGTHTAGTIAAASNGIGIVGVAPNVRIAAIKAGDADGFFFPESVVCAFMWAGTHHVNLTNNSYFADPFYYNCPVGAPSGTAEQTAILTAEERAIRFAQNHGVGVIAAAGNFADDLANPITDQQSPDNATPVTRPVNRDCIIVPATVPGVITVSADGNKRQKSFYSNYGQNIIQVTAPGGDSILQLTPAAPNGRVLSTFPPNATLVAGNRCRATRTITVPTTDPQEPLATYCYLQGTSMASPHVVGVAALILSRHDHGLEGFEQATRGLARSIIRTANPIACPSAAVLATYAPFPSNNNLVNGQPVPQTCTGPANNNSWYGHGEVNALKAVGRDNDD